MTLSLAGYGDAVKKLQRHASEREGIEILGNLEPRDVPGLLAGHHIGMLPMPRTEIWSIASPLKLVEYAAAGLHVVGIDHEGHRWEGQEDWLHLIEGGRGWIEQRRSHHHDVASRWSRTIQASTGRGCDANLGKDRLNACSTPWHRPPPTENARIRFGADRDLKLGPASWARCPPSF